MDTVAAKRGERIQLLPEDWEPYQRADRYLHLRLAEAIKK